MLIKLSPTKYIQLFIMEPNMDMVLSGWEYHYGVFWVTYTKPY